jgi:hypothetical protein
MTRWVENIQMDLVETGQDCMDGIGLVQGKDNCVALMNEVVIFWLP